MNQKDRELINQMLDAYDVKTSSPEFYAKMIDHLSGRTVELPKAEEKPAGKPAEDKPAQKPQAVEAPKEDAPKEEKPQVIPTPKLKPIKTDPKKAQGVGLVLDGGGGKGAYQLGVLKALTEQELLTDVTMISGTSIGAVNAMLYALEDIDLMYRAWEDINMLMLVDIDGTSFTSSGLHCSREDMLSMIEKHIDFDKLKKSKYDIYNTIARLVSLPDNFEAEYRRLNDYDKETIKKIVLASTSLPVIYAPVEIDGCSYKDGGICDNSPVQPLYDAGVRQFIVIGLQHGKVLDTSKWPDAQFISIYPSHDLGDLFEGTLNFDKRSIEFREMLGYKDGLRAVKTKFMPDQMYINLEPMLAQNDYNEIRMQLHVNKTYDSLSSHVNSNIDKFNEIAKKYDL